MIVSKDFEASCMKFGARKQNRKLRGTKGVQRRNIQVAEIARRTKDYAGNIAELLFENCSDCQRMAAIPQGAFAACKVRDNRERNIMIIPKEERERAGKENVFNIRPPLEGWELTPLKYNSKLMNSIWGLYNRYSVHNFKKNNDANEGVFGTFVAVWQNTFHIHAPATNSVTATTVTKNNS